MKTGVIVFARMGSSRFPGKMLFPLLGRPLLGHVLDRARLIVGVNDIVVATSDACGDDAIQQFCQEAGYRVFRGDLQDVASRGLNCCKEFGFDRFVRVCGDRPFMPWDVVNTLIQMQEKTGVDLATNAFPKSFPTGTMSEVLKTSALQSVVEQSAHPDDREHLTRFIYTHSDQFKVFNYEAPNNNWGMINLAIDEKSDVERTEWIMQQLGLNPEFAKIEAVIQAANAWKEMN